MELLILFSSVLYILVAVYAFLIIRHYSKFHVVFISVEYFYILGLGVYPILLAFGYFDTPEAYSNYAGLKDISYLTPLHIVFYSVGAFLGVLLKSFSRRGGGGVIYLSKLLYVKPEYLFIFFTCVAFLSFCFLVYMIGFFDLLSSASSKRAGEDVGAFSFVTRFLILGLFAVAVYPYFVSKNISVSRVTILIYLMGIFAYSLTVSRYALFQAFVLTGLIFWVYNKDRIIVNLYMLLIFIAGLFVIFFGKVFVSYVGSVALGGSGGGLASSQDFEKVMMHFGHLFYSVDAGVISFFRDGPVVARDVILAPLGVVPSSFFNFFSLSDFSYQMVDSAARSSCINSNILGVVGECSVPAYYTGMSAYLCPLVGAFIFGFIRFGFYVSVSKAWGRLECEHDGIKYVPLLLLLFFSLDQVMLFIPSTISLVVFLWLCVFFMGLLRRCTITPSKPRVFKG